MNFKLALNSILDIAAASPQLCVHILFFPCNSCLTQRLFAGSWRHRVSKQVITASLSVTAAEWCPGELYFTPGRTVKFVISILRLQTLQKCVFISKHNETNWKQWNFPRGRNAGFWPALVVTSFWWMFWDEQSRLSRRRLLIPHLELAVSNTWLVQDEQWRETKIFINCWRCECWAPRALQDCLEKRTCS